MTKQTTIDFGARLKEEGIQRAVYHANRVHDQWSDECYKFFKVFLDHTSKPFRVEQFREWAKDVLPAPPHLRAFGGCVRKAKHDGLIKFVGYTQTENPKSHAANCGLWQRI